MTARGDYTLLLSGKPQRPADDGARDGYRKASNQLDEKTNSVFVEAGQAPFFPPPPNPQQTEQYKDSKANKQNKLSKDPSPPEATPRHSRDKREQDGKGGN